MGDDVILGLVWLAGFHDRMMDATSANAARSAADEIKRLREQNAALVEWVMARDWGEERDSILEQIEALQERYRTESAEGKS